MKRFAEERRGGILVATADPALRDEMVTALQSAGFDVQTMENADALSNMLQHATADDDRILLPEVFVVDAALLALSGPALRNVFDDIGCLDSLVIILSGRWPLGPITKFAERTSCLRTPFPPALLVDEVARKASQKSLFRPPSVRPSA